jgi:hypothetical protein
MSATAATNHPKSPIFNPANQPKKKLWQCKTRKEQLAWCEAKLKAGFTLTDPGLFVAGVNPDSIIRSLRQKMKIKTIQISTEDAAGILHKVPAWRLYTQSELDSLKK